jgi:hypothetical protein
MWMQKYDNLAEEPKNSVFFLKEAFLFFHHPSRACREGRFCFANPWRVIAPVEGVILFGATSMLSFA